MTQQPDSQQFQNMVGNAYGVAIFPSVIKAGLGIGGRYGEGVVLKHDQATGKWYGPYFVEMKGLLLRTPDRCAEHLPGPGGGH